MKKPTLKSILFNYPIEPIELMLGVLSIIIGLWLLNPFLNTFNSISAYQYISKILSEPTLGFIMTSLGLSRLIGLFNNNLTLRRVTGLSGNIIWGFLSTGTALGNIAATIVPVFIILSLTSLWIYLRLPIPNKKIHGNN